MHFSKLFMTAMVGAASAAPAVIQQRAMTSANVVSAINDITVLSANLKVTVQGINFSPIAVLDPSTFTPVVIGFNGIITLVKNDIAAMASNPIGTLDVNGQTAVCSAFRNFVTVHQNLLAVLIGKGGLLQSVGGAPIATVLRALEGVVDTIADGIIDAVPTCAAGAQSDAASLKTMIEKAECAYTPAGTLGLDITCQLLLGLSSS
ncbi:0cb864f5-ed55-436c-a74e-906d753fb209 [Sclerotinia trifoliorum]|uniref:0cb864f5-ed55-436c-a74e-906d753fb209 n=1 Tax=Sclerotinia trifoliorum TaxID=28548 RepID=A0A8H2VMU8_9HELO|nr:0cb864f5-ed55-436c-a74e-906d753fb209 [Sclerotinia trifoliorum]